MNTWPGWPKARLGRSRRVRDTAPRAPSTSSRHASCSRARPRKNEQLTRLPGVASLGLGLSAARRPVAPRAQWHAHAGNGLRRLGAPHLVALPGRHRSRVAREAQQPHERQRLPFCANRRVSVTNNLQRCFPWIAAEWHPDRNGLLAPQDVVATSSRVCWWRCASRSEHEWRATVRDRTRGQTTCPFCTHKRVPREDSLAHQHPALAEEWDDAGNDELSPRDVTAGSSRAAFWRCSANSEHRWRVTFPTACAMRRDVLTARVDDSLMVRDPGNREATS